MTRTNDQPTSLTVAEAGERETLRRLLQHLPAGDMILGPGDDAAIIAAPDQRVLITTDSMIEGPDFRLDWSSPEHLGHKAMATNLSDIAAMGARPTGLVVALAVPKSTSVDFIESFAKGCAEALQELAPGCGIVGGDLATSDAVTIAVTAFGSLDGRRPVTRDGARPGDRVAVSGGLGRAAAGLKLLFAGVAPSSDSERALIAAQLAPRPYLAAGIEAAEVGATAMMDLSDGLLLDGTRLAEASDVALDLEMNAFFPDMQALLPVLEESLGLEPDDAVSLATRLILGGGEDHGLLATFPADQAVPDAFRVIGTVIERKDASVLVGGFPAAAEGWDPYDEVGAVE